jgi:hypothetical protein
MSGAVIGGIATVVAAVAAALITAWASKRRPDADTPSSGPNPAIQQTSHPSRPARLQAAANRDTSDPSLTNARNQYEIIDAILGAYPHSSTGRGLSARRQKEFLRLAYEAKLPDGRAAFPVMSRWDGADRRNRMGTHVTSGKAIKDPDTSLYMLADGVTPAELGVRQAVVNALADFGVIPWYDIAKATHAPPDD